MIIDENLFEPKTEMEEGNRTPYAAALRCCYTWDGDLQMKCDECPFNIYDQMCRCVNIDSAADMIDRLWPMLLETTKRLKAAQDVWIPTDRELPPLGQGVLVRVVTPDSRPWLSVARRKTIEFRWEWVLFDGSILCNQVTHWRTLTPDSGQDVDRHELEDLLTFAKAVGLVTHCESEEPDTNQD